MDHATHRYRARLSWEGSTAVGYERYDRRHRVEGLPSPDVSVLSGDPAFGGDADRVNPEQLLVVAAASCQLLSFLAVAARARIDVIAYEDRCEAVMPDDDPPLRLTEIRLRPVITVRGDVSDANLRRYVEIGHRECFIANSLRSDVRIEATFIRT